MDSQLFQRQRISQWRVYLAYLTHNWKDEINLAEVRRFCRGGNYRRLATYCLYYPHDLARPINTLAGCGKYNHLRALTSEEVLFMRPFFELLVYTVQIGTL